VKKCERKRNGKRKNGKKAKKKSGKRKNGENYSMQKVFATFLYQMFYEHSPFLNNC
jgi:hypothetical protein